MACDFDEWKSFGIFRVKRAERRVKPCKSPGKAKYRGICPPIAEKLCMNPQGVLGGPGTKFCKHVEEKGKKVL